MLEAKIQHLRDVPCLTIFKWQHTIYRLIILYSPKNIRKSRQTLGCRMGKKPAKSKVGERAGYPLVGHSVYAHTLGLILAGKGHVMPKKIGIIRPQGIIRVKAGKVFFKHRRLAGFIQNGQAVFRLVGRNLGRFLHPGRK
ncbi:hypothetical protein SDC9_177587 [bioreactor metagenome]|uniref:Uncharacterized protein n=1 Tax=bioreactor metagenome TaxID=1076179 RepID=A0A645GWI1_9ZZZZ